MSSFNMPTEQVELPSKGKLYAESSPLSKGFVDMKYMTAKEEDILSNQNYLKNGIWLDKLLQSMITTKIDYNDLLVGDKDAIILAARILGYGKEYKFRYYSSHIGGEQEVTVDLTCIKEKDCPLLDTVNTNKNEFFFTLPHTNNTISFKLLTVGDEAAIEKEIAGLKKIDSRSSYDITTRLKYLILSVNGDYEKKTIREFVDNAFLARDAKAFREHLAQVTPGIDMKYTFTHEDGVEEDIEIPISMNFFWPESGI